MINKNITATDVLNYHYCPRIIYYVHVLKIPQSTTIKEYKGREKYELFKNKSKRNKILPELPPLPRKYDVYMEWNGLATRADCILFNSKEAMPLQFKYAHKPRAIHHTTHNQLLFEAFLIEKIIGKRVKQGYVKYELSNDLVPVDLSNNHKILKTIENIKKQIQSEQTPPPTQHRRRCIDCCYRKLCWRQ